MIYNRIHDTAPTRRSRGPRKARYVYGDGEAKNRYVYCQYCGFICDTKRDVLQPTSGVSVTLPTTTYFITCEDGSISRTESSSPLLTEGYPGDSSFYDNWHYQYEPIESYTVTHNCPFCGGQYTI